MNIVQVLKNRWLLAALILSGCTSSSLVDLENRVVIPVSAASEPTLGGQNMIAISDVSVIDVEYGVSNPGQTVIVAGDRIERIGASEKINVPEDAREIDGRGLYLIPGLVDAHVHYSNASLFGRVLVANGVLLVRDMGMPNGAILPMRDQLNSGEILGPEMITAGVILDGTPPALPFISLGVNTPEEGREAVRNQVQAGADMIKVYEGLQKEVFLAILDEAQKLGLKAVGHVPDSVTLEEAVEAGLASSEHWFGFGKAVARLLGDSSRVTDEQGVQRLNEVDPQLRQEFYRWLRVSGLTVDPTVITFKYWPDVDTVDPADLLNGKYVSPDLLKLWKSLWAGQKPCPEKAWQSWAQMVMEMNRAGIPLMTGTDLSVPGIIPGFSLHEEMFIWQQAGIPPAEILHSATLVPAEFMGLGERLGSVSKGKTASMVLLRANPLEDIRNAQKIEGVFLRGEYFSRQDLDRMLEEAREFAHQPAQ